MASATASGTRTELTVEGTTISLQRGGAGPPLLFLHGHDAFTSWYPFMSALARERELFVPDHPGFGRSPTPDWLDCIGDLAHCYRAAIDRLQLDELALVGHGLGGWIACELALRDPRGIAALVLVDSAGLPLVRDGVDPFMCSPDELRRFSYRDERRAPPLDDEQLAQRARNALMTARLGWQPRFYDLQLAKWLHRITVPTLIVWGADDAFFPAAQADAFGAAMPGARVTVIPDAGHAPHLEQPAAFSATVAAFLDGVRA